jgi:hypothetical protein
MCASSATSQVSHDIACAERAQFLHRGCVLLSTACPDRDIRASLGKTACHGEAEPAVTAGDDGRAAGEIKQVHAPRLVPQTPFHCKLAGTVR